MNNRDIDNLKNMHFYPNHKNNNNISNNAKTYSNSFNNKRKNYARVRNVSDAVLVVRIMVSLVVILLSMATMYFIFIKLTDIKILDKINFKEEKHDSVVFSIDTNSNTSMFVSDDKGIKFRKSDKTFAREEWIEKNAELFYFDTAGYGLNGDMKKNGQTYTFEKGKLVNIKKDTSYVYRAKSELYNSIETNQYLVWLDNDEEEKGYYPIKYHEYSDDTEDYLGTAIDKQYASANMILINMSNIYYLALGKGTDYAGRLYRMRPGAIHRETIGIGVTGFVVLSDDVVYYCDGSKILKAKSWKGEELKEPLDETDVLPLIATDSNVNETDEADKEIDENVDDKNETIESTKRDDDDKHSVVVGKGPSDDKETTKSSANIKESISQDGYVLPNLPTLDAKIKIVEETIDSNKKNSIVTNKEETKGPVAVNAPGEE